MYPGYLNPYYQHPYSYPIAHHPAPYSNTPAYHPYPIMPPAPYLDNVFPGMPHAYRGEEGMWRQQPIKGQALWTDGGQVTRCGLPWSMNNYMTAAVSANGPFSCGDKLLVRNVTSPDGKETTVTVVDQVVGYPDNKINLHRRAFEAIGANINEGVIEVEVIPEETASPIQTPSTPGHSTENFLMGMAQSAFPGYSITEYKAKEKTELSDDQIKEVFEFTLQSPQETTKVEGTVTYNPVTNKIISFDFKESL